jgi:hypothetical protein
MAKATTAAQLEATAVAGFDGVDEIDVYDAIQDPATYRGVDSEGNEVETKYEKAVVLRALLKPEIGAVNPPEYSLAELNHRFNHVPPAGYTEPVFPHPQV